MVKGEIVMLTYNIRGENIEVTQAIREYVEKRVNKLNKFLGDVEATSHVSLKVYRDKEAKVEVTIPLPFITLRAEETSSDLYASIDLVNEKLERQIRKYKTKVNRKAREKGFKQFEIEGIGEMDEAANEAGANIDSAEGVEEVENPESEFDVVRVKRLELKPMDSEEAILQMNLLGHNFFIYEDSETQDTNIVYRRKDGRYGLIETNE